MRRMSREVNGPRNPGHSSQLAQMVDVAQRMAAGGVGPIGLPPVVDTHAAIGRQDANVGGRLGAPIGMQTVVGQPGCAGHMNPRQVARLPHPGLVAVQHRRLAKRRLDLDLDWLQGCCRLLYPLDQGAQGHRRPEQIGHHLPHTAIGHQLLFEQVDAQGPQPRSILRSTRGLGRKGADVHRLARRATHVQGLMLADHQPHRRHFMDLAPLPQHHRRLCRERGLTGGTDRRPMFHHFVRRGHQP